MCKNALLFLLWDGKGNTFAKGNGCPAGRQVRGGQRKIPASVDSQLPSAQNNPYTNVAYLGVANSGPLPWIQRLASIRACETQMFARAASQC